MRASGIWACVMALGLTSTVMAASPVPESQVKVWKAEEGFVTVMLETYNRLAKFAAALDAEKEFFAAVSAPSREGFSATVAQTKAAQQRLVELGVMTPMNQAGDYKFTHYGKTPSPEAVAAFTSYRTLMVGFDDNPAADEMLTAVLESVKKDPNSLPATLQQALMEFIAFSSNFQAVQMAAAAMLGDALEQNGNNFNSRWGLDELARARRGTTQPLN